MSPWLEGDTFGGHLYPPPPRGEVEIRIVLMALVSAMTLDFFEKFVDHFQRQYPVEKK